MTHKSNDPTTPQLCTIVYNCASLLGVFSRSCQSCRKKTQPASCISLHASLGRLQPLGGAQPFAAVAPPTRSDGCVIVSVEIDLNTYPDYPWLSPQKKQTEIVVGVLWCLMSKYWAKSLVFRGLIWTHGHMPPHRLVHLKRSCLTHWSWLLLHWPHNMNSVGPCSTSI